MNIFLFIRIKPQSVIFVKTLVTILLCFNLGDNNAQNDFAAYPLCFARTLRHHLRDRAVQAPAHELTDEEAATLAMKAKPA